MSPMMLFLHLSQLRSDAASFDRQADQALERDNIGQHLVYRGVAEGIRYSLRVAETLLAHDNPGLEPGPLELVE